MRAALALALLAWGCEGREPGVLVIRSDGPTAVLSPDAPEAEIAFTVDADPELTRLDPRRRDVNDIWLELPIVSYAGTCAGGPCEDGLVTAVLRGADGAVIDESDGVAVVGESWHAFEVHDEDDPYGACAEDEPCSLAFTVEVTLASDSWVTVDPIVLTRVWPDVRPTHEVFEAERLAVTWDR